MLDKGEDGGCLQARTKQYKRQTPAVKAAGEKRRCGAKQQQQEGENRVYLVKPDDEYRIYLVKSNNEELDLE